MFIPTTIKEFEALGWQRADVILVSGDTYIDSPFDGIVSIGKALISAGYRVGIIAQPDLSDEKDILRLGEPELFWGVSSGCVDSMVANYTALGKPARNDDLTPGGINNRRPDRAIIKYVNHLRRYSKSNAPVIIGGIEASLRRMAHYDYWSDKLRRSVLLDSKADYLVYGMGERTILELADKIKNGADTQEQRGIVYAANAPVTGYIELPPYEECINDARQFTKMFNIFYRNNDPLNAKGLCQKHGRRWAVQTPPNYYLEQEELDRFADIHYERDVHPYYKKMGKVRALDTIQFSVAAHRGCYGECNFCAIAVHQGRRIRSRSKQSVLKELRSFVRHPAFRGIVSDIGGPTANMYANSCKKQLKSGSCTDKRCLYPTACKAMGSGHIQQIELLDEALKIKGIKKIFISSGLRYDLVVDDKKYGHIYMDRLTARHVSGQLKIAPEHISAPVLRAMGKPDNSKLIAFKEEFDRKSRKAGKKQFLTYYFIAAHPGCTIENMNELKEYATRKLKLNPEQVQIFTPTPSTYSTLMYYTGRHICADKPIYVEKGAKGKRLQKEALTGQTARLAQSNKKWQGKGKRRR